MSEIEKLMQNVGIEPNIEDCCKLVDKYWNNEDLAGLYVCFDHYMKAVCPHNQECTDKCKNAYDKTIYPEFTAEKQLSLIKWLIHLCKNGEGIKDSYITMEIINNAYRFYLINPNWVNSLHRVFSINENFEEMLAGFINNLWQDLTDTEKAEIKRILE